MTKILNTQNTFNKELPNIIIDEDWLIKTRRDFHQIPEPSFKEFKTSDLIVKKLEELGIKHYKRIADTGVVVDFGTGESPIFGIRADIDALPICEKESKENADYISQHDGCMHACGHDCHIALGLSTIKSISDWLNEKDDNSLNGTLRVFFQPAEETGSGASKMIKEGVLENPSIEKLIGIHVDPSIATGQIGVTKGVALAACDEFIITITGKDGHGSQPHNCQDPITAAAHLITSLQTIISRNIDPISSGVISIGSIISGTRFNIIPETAVIEGTVRSLDTHTQNIMEKRIKDMVSALPLTFALKDCVIDYKRDTPVAVNTDKFSNEVEKTVKQSFGENSFKLLPPSMGAEDFAFYTRKLNGELRQGGLQSCFARLGVTKVESLDEVIDLKSIAGLHNASFNIDEKALQYGVRLFIDLIKLNLL